MVLTYVLTVLASAACAMCTAAWACPEADNAALTLASAAERALCLEPSRARSAAELRQAQAGTAERRAALATQWSVSAGPSLNAQRADGRSSGSAQVSASLNASRTLLDGGARERRLAQSEQDALASAASLLNNELDVQLDFITAWLTLRQAHDSVQASEVAVRSAQATLAATTARQQLGSATRVEVLSARSASAQAERDHIAARLSLSQAEGLLAQRLGWPTATPLILVGDDAALLPAPPDDGIALEDHPLLQAQRAKVAAQREAVQATRAEGGATLSLSGQLGPDTTRSNTTTPRYRTSSGLGGSVAVTWNLPLSDGGSRQATVDKARAALDAAMAGEQSQRRSLQDTVWQARSSLASARADERASAVALEAALAAEDAQRGRYGAGVGTLSEWLQAQADLAQRRQQAANAGTQALLAQARLRAALGQPPFQTHAAPEAKRP